MKPRLVSLPILFAALAIGSLTSANADSMKPLTSDEIRKGFISHTWSGATSGLPTSWTPAERKVAAQLKGKLPRKFQEYYAPNGTIMGWVSGAAFDGYIDGTWKISGNQVCSSYRVHRIWKIADVRAVGASTWCYSFAYKGGKLQMAATKSPAGSGERVGAYYTPRLTVGNAAAQRYNAYRAK